MHFQTGIDLLRIQGDVMWAGAEFTAKVFSEPYLRSVVRKGDGKTPVMTLPGFTGPEVSMQPLNTFLNSNGYVTKHWGLGVNRGVRNMEHMETISSLLGSNVQRMADKHKRKVALVGQSLGGVFARDWRGGFPITLIVSSRSVARRILTRADATLMRWSRASWRSTRAVLWKIYCVKSRN